MKPRAFLKGLGRWALRLLLLVAGLLALALVLLHTPPARALLRDQVNALLSDTFKGKLVIDRIGQLGFGGVAGVDVRMLDAEGKRVILARGVSARISTGDLLRELVAGGEALEIELGEVRVEYIDITLREHAEAGVSLAAAFEPKNEQEPEQEAGKPLELRLPRIHLARIWAHATPGSSLPVNAEITALNAALRSAEEGLSLRIPGARLQAHGLPYAADPRGDLHLELELPSEDRGPLRLEAGLLGRLADTPALLHARMLGGDLVASLLIQPIRPEAINQRVPSLALQSDAWLHAEVWGSLPLLELDLELWSEAAHVGARGYAFVEAPLEAELDAWVKQVDLARALPDAPDTDLALTLAGYIYEPEPGVLRGAHRLKVLPGRVGQESTPASNVYGDFLISETETTTNGRVALNEQGLSVNGLYTARTSAGAETQLGVDLRAHLNDSPRLIDFGIRGSGELELEGQFWPDSQRVQATLSARLSRLAYEKLEASKISLRSEVSGSVAAPRVVAALELAALAGFIEADLEATRHTQTAAIVASKLRADALQRSLELKLPVRGGVLDLNAKVRREGQELSGSVQASARDLDLERVGRGDVRAQLALERHRVSGTVHGNLGRAAEVAVTLNELELPRGKLDIDGLTALRGELSAEGNLDLDKLSPVLVELGAPVERIKGDIRFDVAVRNPRDATAMHAALALETYGLRVVQQRPAGGKVESAEEAIESKPLTLEGLDFRVAVNYHSSPGEAYGTLLVRDGAGTLAELSADADLTGYKPAQLASPVALRKVPLRGRLQVMGRKLESLPPFMRPTGFRGGVGLGAIFEGTLDAPRLRAHVKVNDLHTLSSSHKVDVRGEVAYAPGGGDASIQAYTGRGCVMSVVSRWQGDLRELGKVTESAQAPVRAEASAALREFPVDVLPQLAAQQLRGRLDGDVRLRDWGRDARLDASISSQSLAVANLKIDDLRVSAKAGGNRLLSEVGLRLGQGSARARLEGAMQWGARPVPRIERDATATLQARDFQLRALTPILASNVSEIAGRLDAETKLTVTPDATELTGQARLRQGVLQLPAIGQRFSDIRADVAVSEDRIRLQQLTARGSTGRLSASGSATLDGFELRRAEGKLEISKDDKIPLTLQGAVLGDAWGNVAVRYVNASPQTAPQLEVDVQRFGLVMPESGSYGLQDLEPAEDIRIGVRRADGRFVELPVQPLEPADDDAPAAEEPQQPLRIGVTLRNVTVERGQMVSARLGGELDVISGKETLVTGRIEIRGGELDVQGKTFEIERGVITFTGENPGNPTITATARWDSPAGYTVYAEYLGTVEDGKIRLRSEPPLTDDQIANLLMFGSPESSGGGTDPTTESVALGVAGGTATRGLNKALSDFTSLDVSTRIDTSTGSARPELVFQVTPRLEARVTRAVGEPPAGQSPDRTFLTLELRIRQNWALSGTLGDYGASALDLIWRKRY
jgi:hypothetical protein